MCLSCIRRVSLNAAISACEKGGQWQRAMQLLAGGGFGGDASAAVRRDAASFTSAITALSRLSRGGDEEVSQQSVIRGAVTTSKCATPLTLASRDHLACGACTCN